MWCSDVGIKEVDRFLAFLVAGVGSLFFALAGQFSFQAAFTVTVHFGPIPVLTKVFGYVLLVRIIFGHDHHAAKCLEQDAAKG